MTAFSAFIATSAVLLSAHCASARELTHAGDLPAGLIDASGMKCGETAFEACCPAEYGACAPGLLCMGNVCEPCGDEGEEDCDDGASKMWGTTFMVEEDEDAVVSVPTVDATVGVEAMGGLYGSEDDGMYGGYGDDDDSDGSYGADRSTDGGSTGGSGEEDPATENQDGSSANVNSGGSGIGGTPRVLPNPDANADVPGDSSSSSIAPATAAVIGVAALVAGVGAIAYVKRATLFSSGAAAAAASSA